MPSWEYRESAGAPTMTILGFRYHCFNPHADMQVRSDLSVVSGHERCESLGIELTLVSKNETSHLGIDRLPVCRDRRGDVLQSCPGRIEDDDFRCVHAPPSLAGDDFAELRVHLQETGAHERNGNR